MNGQTRCLKVKNVTILGRNHPLKQRKPGHARSLPTAEQREDRSQPAHTARGGYGGAGP